MCRPYNVIQRRVERIGTSLYGNGVLCLGDVEEGHVGSAGIRFLYNEGTIMISAHAKH